MANQFDTDFAERAWDGFKRTQGTVAKLTPSGGAQVDVDGTWEPWAQEDEFDDTGKRLSRRGVYALDPADVVPPWTPDVLDRFEIDGVPYAVNRIAQTLPVAVMHLVEWRQRRIHGRNTFRDR